MPTLMVARSAVRNFVKSLPSSDDMGFVSPCRFVLLLLGGARCYNNSASQTEEEVYRQGRKFHSALLEKGAKVRENVKLRAQRAN